MLEGAIGPLLEGALATVALSLLGTVLATAIGVVAAVIGQQGRILGAVVWTYVSFIRGTPLLIQVFVIYYVLPSIGIDLSALAAGAIALGINGGAHIREMIRGALTSIAPGEIEAGRALAMPRFWIWTRIILPQLFILVLPPLTVEFSALLKGSALISVIGYVELTRQAQYLLATSAHPYQIWLLTAVLYFVMCFALTLLTRRLQHATVRAH
jgi:His/Glu/Gln/Arg/opine family amino acid ABC transporter permease subunit